MAGSKFKQKPQKLTRTTDMRSFHDLRYNTQTESDMFDTAKSWQDYILKVSQVWKLTRSSRYLAHSEDVEPGAGKRCSWRDVLWWVWCLKFLWDTCHDQGRPILYYCTIPWIVSENRGIASIAISWRQVHQATVSDVIQPKILKKSLPLSFQDWNRTLGLQAILLALRMYTYEMT